VRLHVHEWGPPKAPVLLCLHGVTGHGIRFRRLSTRLQGRRLLAPDLRGHGLSDWEPPWDLVHYLGDVLETMDALGLDRVDVAGHSFGGRLALELAAEHPERVDRLVLLDPAVWVPPPIAFERADRMRIDEAFASVDEAIQVRLAENPHARPSYVEEELPEYLRRSEDGRLRFGYSRSAVVAAYGEMAKPPPLERVRARTLLIRGVVSDVVPEPIVDVVRERLVDCEIVTVPGGHMVLWNAFDETADAMRTFLDTPAA
jgi:lipase